LSSFAVHDGKWLLMGIRPVHWLENRDIPTSFYRLLDWLNGAPYKVA
jgi:hypothetical protein